MFQDQHAKVLRAGTEGTNMYAPDHKSFEGSLNQEVRDYAFPLLTDSCERSFPITDRQALNHFLVYGPKSAARSSLLFDIAEANVRRGSGLLHVSTMNDDIQTEIHGRTPAWSGFGQIAAATYSGTDNNTSGSLLDKVFDDRWILFIRLPDPAKDPEAAIKAEARFCADLMNLSKRIGEDCILGHWRRQYNGGARIFTHAPTPIVFDDASRYVGGLSGMQAAMFKGLGFSAIYGVEDDAAFGANDPKAAADVLRNAMTKVVMGDSIAVTCGLTPMPRLGAEFFRRTASVRDQRSSNRTLSQATAG